MACPVRVVGIESPGIESLLQGPIPFLSGFIWLAGWLLDPLAHTSQYSPPTHTDWLAIWVLLDLISNTADDAGVVVVELWLWVEMPRELPPAGAP